MAILFRAGFDSFDTDNVPVTTDMFPDYTTVINGGGTADAMSLSTVRGAQSGSSIYLDTTSGDRFVITTFSTGTEEFWMRVYIYNTQAPAGDTRILRCRSDSTNNIASVYLNSDNKFFIASGVSTTPLWTSTNAYLNKWVRLEWHVSAPAAGGGTQRFRIFADGDLQAESTEWTEQSSLQAVQTFAGLVQTFAFGAINTNFLAKYYMDEIVINNGQWPGPVVTFPTASFTQNTLSGSAPLTVNFTNTSTDAVSYEWDFGDGTPVSNSASPTHIYQRSGTYIVILTAYATNQEKLDTVEKTVTVATSGSSTLFTLPYDTGPVDAVFTDTRFSTVGDGSLLTYTDQSVIKNTFALSVDGRNSSAGLSYGLSPAATQLFFRTYLTITKAPTSGPMMIAVAREVNGVVAGITVNQQGIWSIRRGASGDFGNLSAESVSAVPYGVPIRVEWLLEPLTGAVGNQELRLFVGSNIHGSTPDITITGRMAGESVDNIRFGILRSCGGRAVFDATAVGTQDWIGSVAGPNAFSGVPLAAFKASKLLVAEGGSIDFTNLATGSPTSNAWTFGDSGTSTSTSPSHTYATGGVYTASLIATNSSGASVVRTLDITVLAADRGQAVLKVWSDPDGSGGVAGDWYPVATNSTLLKIRSGQGWTQDSRPRVFKDGQWSSNEPLTGGTTDPPNQTGGGGWGPGTQGVGSWSGSSLGITGTSDQNRYDKTKTLFGDISVIRTYDTSFPTTWGNTTGRNHLSMTGTEVIHYSNYVPNSVLLDFKNNVTSTIDTWQARMDAFCATIPNDIRIILTTNHEPDKGASAGRYDQEGFRICQKMMQDAVDAERESRSSNVNWLKFATVIMGVSYTNGTMTRWLIPEVDSWGADPYYASSAKAAATYCNNHDMNWVIGEFAGHKATVDGQPNDSAFRLELHNLWLEFYWRAAPRRARTLTYWNAVDANTGYSSVISPDNGYPLSSAYWKSVCETGYPPTTFWKP
jgi:PKD repeat protein